MTEISLREYLAKLDNLLHANAADEVIHHCRHILQYFPKNVDAYRYLGRALVNNGRWDEAHAALQRVLSVVPDDFDAHVGLSEAFQNSDKPDDAIWHLERAFEQRTADKVLLDQLRSLYRRYRGVENAKIPLTAVAVARQSVKSRSFAQAADTLRSALTRSPLRIDLRLLLAEVLWLKDARIEAAELAIDVLEKLPDCLSANRIMTQLWLAEGRPTDAQRYINRIESVDPYQAVELVSQQPVEDNAFRLDELDYRRSAQSEVAAENPDWLEDIDDMPFPTSTSAFVTTPTPSSFSGSTGSSSGTMPPVKGTSPLIDKDIPADNEWQEWVSAMLEGTPKPAEKPPMSGEEWLKSQSSLTDSAVLHTFEAKNTSELDEIDSLFSTGGLSSSTSGFDFDDPIAWLRDAGVEVTEEEDLPPSNSLLFDEDEFRPPERNDSPVAWMDKYGGADQFGDEFPDPFASPTDAPIPPSVPNLFADEPRFDDWMNAPETPTSAPTESEWEIDMDEFDDISPPDQPKLDVTPELFPEEQPNDEPEQPIGVPGPKRGLTAMLSESAFDWNEPTNIQPEDEWLAQFDDKKITASVTTTNPDWLSVLDDDSADNTVERLDMPDMDDLTWLSNEVPQSGGASGANGGAANAEGNQADASTSGADDEFSWMSDFDEVEALPADLPLQAADVPDWLTELEPKPEGAASLDDADQPPDTDAEVGDVSWMSAFDQPVASTDNGVGDDSPLDDDDEEFAWLEDADALSDDDEALPADAVPDWMSELAPGEHPLSSVDKEDDLDWMSAFDQPSAADEDALAPMTDDAPLSDMPEWLTELESTTASAAPEASAEFPMDDLFGEAAPSDEPAPTSAAPAGASASDEFAWMLEETSFEEDDQAEAVTPDLADTISLAPDWLSELQPKIDAVTSAADVVGEPLDEPQAELDAVGDDEFAWMEEVAAEDVLESMIDSAPTSDIPDWLSELEPKAETSAVGEPQAEPVADAVGEDEFAWMDEINLEDAALTDDALLTDETALTADAVSVGQDDLEWISAFDDEPTEGEPVAVAGESAELPGQDEIEWMTALDDEPAAEAEPLAVAAVAEGGELDWLSELDEDGALEDGALDEEPIEAAVPAEEFAWTEDEEAEFIPAAPESAAVTEQIVAGVLPPDTEPWTPSEDEEIAPIWEEQAEAELVPEIASSAADDLDVINEPETFETVADNAPDWLNAMVPGLDVDYAPAEEIVEEEPAAAETAEPSSAREFAWLNKVVEEETNAAPSTPYRFSKAPAWLQRLFPPPKPAASEPDADLPDWASDDDDLPEWLRK